MYRIFRPATLTAALVTALLLVCCSKPGTVREAGIKPANERKTAPDFTLKDAEGKGVSLSEFRGKVVLLDFWATWCGPCEAEIPWLIDVQRKNKDRGFAVLGVSMDDEGWAAVKPFVTRMGVNYRVVMGNDKTSQLYGGIDSLPTTFLIDRDGRIATVRVGSGGEADEKDIEHGIDELLRAPSPAANGAAAATAVAGTK